MRGAKDSKGKTIKVYGSSPKYGVSRENNEKDSTMPIRQTTPMSEVTDYLNKRLAAIEEITLRNLSYIGEQVLNQARSAGNYKDQTGNLRSSIGYIIVKDGRIVRSSDFGVVKDGDKGAKDGKQFARRLAQQYNSGIVLIVVAGMNYAAYVKKRGYDVLDSSELLADKLVPQMFKELGIKS